MMLKNFLRMWLEFCDIIDRVSKWEEGFLVQATQNKELSNVRLLIYFIVSLMFNCLGNALTVALNLGSALWTAAAVNISDVTPVSLSMMLFIFGVLIIITNVILLNKIDVKRIIGNFIFMVPFSTLVGAFSPLLINVGITSLPLFLRVVLDCMGVVFISVAISIYQRINWMLHPADDLMQIVRFKFFKGNSSLAQLVVFMPPIIAIIVSYALTHQIYAINIGTVFALLFQGGLVGVFDKIVFPDLKHRNLE